MRVREDGRECRKTPGAAACRGHEAHAASACPVPPRDHAWFNRRSQEATSMRLFLRFIILLGLALAAIAYAVAPLADRLSLRWFVRDLEMLQSHREHGT